MRERVWKDNKGFTLIEIVITTVVLATISVPLLAYFSDSMRHSAITKEQQNAVVAAQDAVEELKVADYSLDADKVIDPSAAPKYSWTIPTPMPTGSGVPYEMYKNYEVNGKSYNVVAKITPKSSVSNVYNSSSDDYSKTLDYSEALVPSMSSSTDVISTESIDYTAMAAQHFYQLYTDYCNKSNGAVVDDPTKVNATTIAAHLERQIKVHFEAASETGKVKVSVTYLYTYVRDASDEFPQAVLDAHPAPHPENVLSKSMKTTDLKNIFIFYKPLEKKDEILISAETAASSLGIPNMNLYVIAESSVASHNATTEDVADKNIVVRSSSYSMNADCNSTMDGVIKEVYTNLTNDSGDEFYTGSSLHALLKKDASNHYTLITKKEFNRLADITVTVYRDTGSSYPFSASDKLAEVDGNKVQK